MAWRLRLRRDQSELGLRLAEQAAELVAGAELLAESLDGDREVRAGVAQRLQEVDYRSEVAAHAVLRALTAAFVTPFDRADVYRVCWAMRTATARMDAVGDELFLFGLGDLPATTPQLVSVIVRCAEVNREAVARLAAPARLVDPWLELTRLGKQGGQVHRRLLAELSTVTTDPGLLIRHVSVAQSLRRVVEAFEDLADALQTVAVRES
jgi:uncharacterized protein